MAKVAIDIRLIGNNRTGDETVFFELVKKLLSEHKEHSYVLLTDKTAAELVTVRERLGLEGVRGEVELVNFGPRNRFWWNAITLPFFFLGRHDIEVFHTQYILPFWIPKRVAVVAHIHDISFARYPQYIGKKDLFFLNLFIPRTMKRAHLITPSEFTKREIQNVYQVPAEDITVVPNALGSVFKKSQEGNMDDARTIQTKYGLPEKYLLYVGTLQPRKNIPYLLKIFAELKKKGQYFLDTQLVLVGNRGAHHFDTGIDSAIKELGLEDQIIFPGYVDSDDLPLIYQHAVSFIFPSKYEGFGIPILEALASNIPTFASDIAVHREIGGEQLEYFPLDDVAEAAKILYTISVTQSAQQTSNALSQKTKNVYSWGKSADILAHLYQDVKNKSIV